MKPFLCRRCSGGRGKRCNICTNSMKACGGVGVYGALSGGLSALEARRFWQWGNRSRAHALNPRSLYFDGMQKEEDACRGIEGYSRLNMFEFRGSAILREARDQTIKGLDFFLSTHLSSGTESRLSHVRSM